MNTTADLENQVLGLPPADRARLLLKAWESLADDFDVAADPAIDAQGVVIALARDAELASGVTKAIDDVEFRRRTGP
jgi:Putative addiction module component